jgi:hypothetical protein
MEPMAVNLSKIKWIAVFAAIILGIFFLLQQSCDLGEQIGKLKGQLKEQQNIYDADKAISNGIIAEQSATISNQTKKINDLLANAGKPTPAEKEKDKEISKLKEKWSSLSAECQTNLVALDKAWSDKFTLAETRHKGELFSLNASWQVKFDAQVVITDQYKKRAEDCEALGKTKDALISKLNIKLKTTRLLSKAETVALAVAGGFIVYNAVKK